MVWTTGFQFLGGAMMKFYSLCHCIQTSSRVYSNSYPLGTREWGIIPEVKWPACEADQSSLSSAKVKKACGYTSTPQYVFMVWCLMKQEICVHGMELS